jgi:hypothetical protein
MISQSFWNPKWATLSGSGIVDGGDDIAEDLPLTVV